MNRISRSSSLSSASLALTMETTIVNWGYIGIVEKKMETTIVNWGYIGIMEKKMETTIVYWDYILNPERSSSRSQVRHGVLLV